MNKGRIRVIQTLVLVILTFSITATTQMGLANARPGQMTTVPIGLDRGSAGTDKAGAANAWAEYSVSQKKIYTQGICMGIGSGQAFGYLEGDFSAPFNEVYSIGAVIKINGHLAVWGQVATAEIIIDFEIFDENYNLIADEQVYHKHISGFNLFFMFPVFAVINTVQSATEGVFLSAGDDIHVRVSVYTVVLIIAGIDAESDFHYRTNPINNKYVEVQSLTASYFMPFWF